MHIICDGTGNHDKSPLVILYKGQVLLQKVSPPGLKAEFEAVVLAHDSGMYECIAALNDVYKSVYANLTVNGEKPVGEQMNLNFMSLLALKSLAT